MERKIWLLSLKSPREQRMYFQKTVIKDSLLKKIFCEEAKNFGYKEIRTLVFENTELFERGVGDTTDVVQKEMYTFTTKGGDSITLRPEGTAGAARAMLEHGVYNDGLPVKAYYLVSCYRYEKPQAGRLREFHQFGMECYGTACAAADAEMISAAASIFERLQIRDLELQINSIGCKKCRAEYHKALKAYFEQYKNELCDTCKDRLNRNPMRILDCKSPVCSEISKNAPVMLNYLCDECKEHFEKVKSYLDSAKIEYIVNPKIVRGLDYYTKTVFEFVSSDIGAQSTVCGGGRYDGLIEELGGQSMPSLGFALGIERLLLLMEAQNIEIPMPQNCEIFIGSMGDEAYQKAFSLVTQMRKASLYAEFDVVGRGLRAQMKYADKIKAAYSLVIGENEIKNNKAVIKNMSNGNHYEISLDDEKFMHEFIEIKIKEETEAITEERER